MAAEIRRTTPLPTGTVTFLFTDIEGSTHLAHDLGEKFPDILAEHQRLLRDVLAAAGGLEVSTHGDAFFAVFPLARDAVAAAVTAQKALRSHGWPHGAEVRVRMGLHTGEGTLAGDDYAGLDVHRAARISAAGHGGQILLSEATRALIGPDPLDGVTLVDLGAHRLKDLRRPTHLFQVLHADLPSEFPTPRSLNVLPNNLPVQLTTFIGRETEIDEVKALLGGARLVTLLGAGGAGKTRLAVQVGADLLETYRDGVWLVELAPIAEPDLVAQTVASSLGLREPARAPTDALVDFLRQKSLLLIVDNCEHVLQASADLCAPLLRASPELQILATSRETLGVGGEATYRVPPLPLPDPRRPASLDQVGQAAAVRLFVERAALYQPGFALTSGNVGVIVDLCRRLDGIPLAIELAAARVKVLSLEQIVSRLEDRFRLLTGGARTGLPHHQTLRAAMDWSHDLLDEDERVLFRRLAVFAGGFVLETAEGVCAGDGLDAGQILDLLAQLVDKSLVVVEEGASGEVRYRLLETVRQYALGKLVESGEVEAVRNRHRDAFLQLAERAEAQMRGPDEKAWLDRLEIDHDNFRAALEWCRTTPGGGEAGLRLATALWWFWEVRGYWAEGSQWLQQLLAVSADAPATLRVKAMSAAASLALRLHDLGTAGTLAQQSLVLSRELGDKRSAASCLVILGVRACRLEDYKEAEALGGESLTLSRESGDNWGTAWAQVILGLVAREERDYGRARTQLEESLGQMRALGHQWGVAIALEVLGLIARDEGQTGRAVALLQDSLTNFEQLGDKSFAAYVQLNLGAIALTGRDFERAGSMFRATLVVRRELKEERGIATCLAALACVAAGLGQFQRAAKLFGAADAQREATGASIPALLRSEYDRWVSVVHEGLREAGFQVAWAEGRALSMEEAVEFALPEGETLSIPAMLR